jgi:hypothetical protein
MSVGRSYRTHRTVTLKSRREGFHVTRHDQRLRASAIAVAQELDEIGPAFGNVARFRVRADELPSHLILQLVTINNDANGRLLKLRVMPQLPCRKKDRETLAAALRVPDETTPPFLFAVEVESTSNNLVSCCELLITRHFLNRAAFFDLENDKVAENVEEVASVKQAEHRTLHSVSFGNVGVWGGIAPFVPGVKLRSRHTVAEHQLIDCTTE